MFRVRYQLVIGLLLLTLGAAAVHARTSVIAPQQEPATVIIDRGLGDLNPIYQAVSPSVVAINVSTSVGRRSGGATGSGFVIDNEGHIITNNHVVENADAIEIEFFDGHLATATIVGLDPDSDLALLDVDVPGERLFPVTFGNSDALVVGQPVLAIGSPYGQDWTLTTGIVSGLDRVITGLTNFSIGGVIQTDAAINPGNSGGPLLNLQGEIVGVNSQILSQSGSNSGVGFAIPSNLVQRVARELEAGGSVDYSYMGIAGADVTLQIIDELGLPDDTRGVVVTAISRNGPADEAGIQNAIGQDNSTAVPTNFDVITAIDGNPIKGMNDLISYLARSTTPGQTVTLSILRDGNQPIQVPLTLTSRPS